VVSVTITPDTGFTVSYFENLLGNTSKETPTGSTKGSPVTIPVSYASTSTTLPGEVGTSFATVWAVFRQTAISVGAAGDGNSSVNLGNIPFVYPGLVAPSKIPFIFTAAPGYVITAVSNTAGFTVSPLNLPVVTVTIPKGYIFGSALNFVATSAPSTTAATLNAGNSQTVLKGAAVTLTGTSVGPVPTSPAFTLVANPGLTKGIARTALVSTGLSATFSAYTTGTYVFQLNATNAASPALTSVLAVHTLPPVATNLSVGAACQGCHTANGVSNGASTPTIYAAYSSGNTHKNSAHSACTACHYGTGTGGHPGTVNFDSVDPQTFLVNLPNINAGGPGPGGEGVPTFIATPGPGVVFCQYCHNANSAYGVPAHVYTPLNAGVTCTACHTDPLGQLTGTGDAHGVQPLPSCVNCHAVAQPQVNATLINDNSGVRAITGEFSKWSHHVTGRAVQDSDCATCHMEGSVRSGVVSVDANYHMADDYIHLRNCNTALVGNQSRSATANIEAKSGGVASTGTTSWVSGTGLVQYLWNPDAAPAAQDHTAMDQFCFSCHNSGGAPTAIAAVGSANPLATASNPFGDTISNQYDMIQRPAVVAVFDQFDIGNTSHHAVRGTRYNTITLSPAAYANISTVNSGTPGFKLYSAQSKTVRANNKALIGTMSQLGVMNTLYTPVGGTVGTLADNSTLHCADCHTVGQNKPNATVNSLGVAITQVIGAHGSNNEYMLRKPDGSESHHFSNLSTSSTLVGSGPGVVAGLASQNNLVCYLCHNASAYQPADSHDGVGPCLADGYNTPGLIGHIRIASSPKNLLPLGGSSTTPPGYSAQGYSNMSSLIAASHFGSGGGSNIFGNKCLNCHNAGATNGGTLNFGGIHGNKNNATYGSFSSPKVASLAAPAVAVTRYPYRFLPGLGNIGYNGGNNTNAWQQKYTNTINSSQGCYTLQGTSTKGNSALIYAQKGTFRPTDAAATSDNGVLGSWGACSDHSGTSVSPTSDVPTRTILRPLSY
jgi:hypothetical protein